VIQNQSTPSPPVGQSMSATIPECRRCGRHHRRWSALAKCRFKAIWVSGDHRFASVSFCPRGPTVQCYATLDEAREARAAIDAGSCGGMCWRQHGVFDLALVGGRVA
jgi:hypothetical protein